MKKFLFALVAIMISMAAFADPTPSTAQIPNGPVCPANAPCDYYGDVAAYKNGTLSLTIYTIKVKVVRDDKDHLIGQVIESNANNINVGESGYVYEDKSKNAPATHYFTVNGYRLYFNM